MEPPAIWRGVESIHSVVVGQTAPGKVKSSALWAHLNRPDACPSLIVWSSGFIAVIAGHAKGAEGFPRLPLIVPYECAFEEGLQMSKGGETTKIAATHLGDGVFLHIYQNQTHDKSPSLGP
jgi:hypothetical protein